MSPPTNEVIKIAAIGGSFTAQYVEGGDRVTVHAENDESSLDVTTICPVMGDCSAKIHVFFHFTRENVERLLALFPASSDARNPEALPSTTSRPPSEVPRRGDLVKVLAGSSLVWDELLEVRGPDAEGQMYAMSSSGPVVLLPGEEGRKWSLASVAPETHEERGRDAEIKTK
jgi:hypothetical protein